LAVKITFVMHALLESALNRPFQTFDSLNLYPTNLEKAAAITQSLVINHPFMMAISELDITCLFILLIMLILNLLARKKRKETL
jgi:death-on-curing protein